MCIEDYNSPQRIKRQVRVRDSFPSPNLKLQFVLRDKKGGRDFADEEQRTGPKLRKSKSLRLALHALPLHLLLLNTKRPL